MFSNFYRILKSIEEAYIQKKSYIFVKKKKFILKFLNLLLENKLILGYEEDFFLKKNMRDFGKVKIFLYNSDYMYPEDIFKNKKPFSKIQCISSNGRKKFFKLKELKKMNSTYSIFIVSSSIGITTLDKVISAKIGGEVLFKILI